MYVRMDAQGRVNPFEDGESHLDTREDALSLGYQHCLDVSSGGMRASDVGSPMERSSIRARSISDSISGVI